MEIPKPLPYVAAFEKLGYGMFIHWGLYSQLGKGEWAQNILKIPCQEYDKLADTFTAENFDARAIARLARDSGMKYIVLTTRHHDGFSLYDTCGLNEFDAPHSAAKRDLIREFVDGCREFGIIPFFYHTTLDWHWHGKSTRDLDEEEFAEYLVYLRRSVEILCTNYGKIGGLWFDGNWSRKESDWQEDLLYGVIRKHQPEAIIVNNTGLSARGKTGHPEIDSVTYENDRATKLNRAGMTKYVAGEVCKTINAHWGRARMDFKYLSSADIIELLCHTRNCGANLLLNIGPGPQGEIPLMERALLETAGRWCSVFGEAIYETKPADDIKCPGRDFILKNGNDYYYFVHDMAINGSEEVIVAIGNIGTRAIDLFKKEVVSVTWLDDGAKVPYTQDLARGVLALTCVGYPYGVNTCVRVAKIQTRPTAD